MAAETHRVAVELAEKHICKCDCEKGVYAAQAKKVGGGVKKKKWWSWAASGRECHFDELFEFFRALAQG
jgi:hypothetical protein